MLSRFTTRSSSLVKSIPKRSYTFFGSKSYLSGNERAILDKLKTVAWPSSLSLFTLFGLLNGFCYGLSYFMKEKDYVFHFGYKQNGRYSEMIKSQFGSNNLINAAWTSPLLIVGGHYMQSKMGYLRMLQFAGLTLVSVFACKSAFGPNPNYSSINFKPLDGWFPKVHSNGFHSDYGHYYMGADQLACSLLYLGLLYHRQWYIAMALMGVDLLYYGPQHLGGAAPALFAGMTML